MNKYMRQLFDAPTGTNVAADFAPVISVDHVNRLAEGIKKLQEVLGITELRPMAEGTQIKIYKTGVQLAATQAGEGETIALSKTTRTLARTITMTLDKFRKATTAEAIQSAGVDHALNESDEKLVREVQKGIRNDFYSTILAGSGTASVPVANGFQAAAAACWGDVKAYFEDEDTDAIFFVNPIDVAGYLATASVSTQTAFGMTYIENFLGLGPAILSSKVTSGKIVGTAKENLNGAYIPQGGDVANAFGLSFDETGLVGMTHAAKTDNATVETLILEGVKFYAEDVDGVFVTSITSA